MVTVNGWRKKYLTPRGPKKPMKCYERRGEALHGAGYTRYEDYLKGEEWRAIRGRKLKKRPQCLLCGRAATQVHHLDYSEPTLLGMHMDLLVSLCDGCHEDLEYDGKQKRTLAGANRRLFSLAEAVGRKNWADSTRAALRRVINEANKARPRTRKK